LGVLGAPDGALDVQLLGISRIFSAFVNFSQSSLSSLRFASEGHFWEQSLARGRPPLHWAADKGCVEVVKLLLEAKASVTVKDSEGRGPWLGDGMGFC
jgi:ankyrin repeat protein